MAAHENVKTKYEKLPKICPALIWKKLLASERKHGLTHRYVYPYNNCRVQSYTLFQINVLSIYVAALFSQGCFRDGFGGEFSPRLRGEQKCLPIVREI